MAGQFDGKAALITGAGSGIGRDIALAFARECAEVAVTDISESGANETIQMIQSQCDRKAIFIKADASVPEQMEAAVRQTVDAFGRLDFACNNAGIGGPAAPAGEYPVDGWQKVIAVNLNGVFYSMRYEIPAMLKVGGGSIVNMASILALVGFAGSCAYVAAKHGVIGLTQTAASEYATQGVRVNAVCPGFIETPLLENAGIKRGTDPYNNIASMHPMKRLGTTREIAETVIFLCSDASSFTTGASIVIDGGYTAV